MNKINAKQSEQEFFHFQGKEPQTPLVSRIAARLSGRKQTKAVNAFLAVQAAYRRN